MIFLESTIGKCNTSNCVAKVFEIFMSLRYERNIYVNETSPTFFFFKVEFTDGRTSHTGESSDGK